MACGIPSPNTQRRARMLRRVRTLLPVLVVTVAVLVAGVVSTTQQNGGRGERRGDDRGGRGNNGRKVSGLDKNWLQTSIQGDRFEIQGGQIAQQKGTTQG